MNSRTLVLALGVLYGLVSCKPSDTDKKATFYFEVKDSVLVDVLADMELVDYDPEQERFLIVSDSDDKYLEIGPDADVLLSGEFQPGGTDPVGSILGIGYVDGDVTVLSEVKGYLRFRNSQQVGKINFPVPYVPYVSYPKLGIFEYGGKQYYPMPMSEQQMSSPGEFGFYKSLYEMPILQAQDLVSGDTSSTMRIPATSPVRDGRMHGMIFPVYTETEDYVLMSTWIEPTLYVYRKEGTELVFDRMVDLGISEWQDYQPSGDTDASKFFMQFQRFKSGSLEEVLALEDCYAIVYRKGIPEESMPEPNENREMFNYELLHKNPYFAVILDHEFNVLAENVPLPTGIHTPRVVDKVGDIWVSKNANLSEVEDDGIVLYTMALKEKY